MATTLKSKWHFGLLAAFLYLTAPVANAIYYWVEDNRGAYPANADTIAIPIYFFAIAMLLLSPLYGVAVWLATRSYIGGRSFFAFNLEKPIGSALWSLLLGAMIFYDIYDAAGKVNRVLPVEVISDIAWIYLLLCLRSSLAGSGSQLDRKMSGQSRG